eukprot:753374-Hanusia_phi.AAC.11
MGEFQVLDGLVLSRSLADMVRGETGKERGDRERGKWREGNEGGGSNCKGKGRAGMQEGGGGGEKKVEKKKQKRGGREGGRDRGKKRSSRRGGREAGRKRFHT